MNSTNRTPFTVPLTSTERRFIQVQIDLKLREMGRHDKSRMSREIDFHQEVADALGWFDRLGPTDPEVAQGALVGA